MVNLSYLYSSKFLVYVKFKSFNQNQFVFVFLVIYLRDDWEKKMINTFLFLNNRHF